MVVQCDRGAQLQHLLTGLSIIETGDQYNLPSTLVIHHFWPVDDNDSALIKHTMGGFLFFFFPRLVTTWPKKPQNVEEDKNVFVDCFCRV